MLTADLPILQGRYTLKERVATAPDHEIWCAVDKNENDLLVKAWPYSGDRPDDVLRALWDAELGNLFRLASSPEAEARLVVLRDARIDKTIKHLVLVMQAPGYATLEQLLQNRVAHDWLRELTKGEVRAKLWRGLRRLTLGLAQLHEQQMLHCAVSAAAVFVHPDNGPDTMRLGGFEFTVRVGGPRLGEQKPTLIPPELLGPSGVASFESDWFLLGALAARLIAKAEPRVGDADPYQTVVEKINSDTSLYDVEREVIRGMLVRQPGARLARGQDVIDAIDNVLLRIDQPARLSPDAHLGLVVALGEGQLLTRAIVEEDETIQAGDLEKQRAYIEKDLQQVEPSVVRINDKSYILLGHKLAYWLNEEDAGTDQWTLGKCNGPAELRRGLEQVRLKQVPIRVLDRKSLRKYGTAFRRNAVSWKPYLPRREEGAAARELLQRFHEFFRVTNQIDLLFSDAVLFGYERLSYTKGPPEEIVIRERPRVRPAWRTGSRQETMIDFLSREYAEKQRDGDQVYLGTEEEIRIFVEDPLWWKIVPPFDFQQRTLTLRRSTPGVAEPPVQGFLRGYGLVVGQMVLLDRRKRAIDKLKTHAYLLTALLRPDFFYIFTGDAALPQPIAAYLDEAKQNAIKAIWETRPIFALQGPPGTGKTTLVASLLGQIFADDPVAQVLVTAQAHPAVDVLRAKVREETFATVPDALRPLSIRMRRTSGKFRKGSDRDLDYPEVVAQRMLEEALAAIGPNDGGVRGRWRDAIKPVRDALLRGDSEEGAGDFGELVKHSANITYCTTTSANLANLAVSNQSFDWSIIEEAGKAHGFDLVLPLQNGHRWVLIGDHKQLPPYRDYDFRYALNHLDDVVQALWNLPNGGSGLVDKDFLQAWKEYDDSEKSDRLKMWSDWLAVFAQFHRTCEEKKWSGPSLVDMLWQQHRMHPTIAELISRAYYDRKIVSMTVDGQGRPTEKVTHSFVLPEGIAGKAILWLDLPWVNEGGGGEEFVDGGYTSTEEVRAVNALLRQLRPRDGYDQPIDVAVLSPYRRQVVALSDDLQPLFEGPEKVEWIAPLEDRKYPASTVDAFQGNQAKVVIVSLVRNNDGELKRPLGFLDDATRMNVLFSRAEQLLVLVGSWNFFQNQLGNIDPEHPDLGHWRLALDYLAECFRDGSALRLKASDQ
jgi:hypothetical protein